MDPVISASIYVSILLISRGLSDKITNPLLGLGMVLLVILNHVQFAFFTGLWPFYVFAVIDSLIIILFTIGALGEAVKDAKNA